MMLTSESSFKRYILHFDPKENSKADVKNIKVIMNHIIKWLPAKPMRKGPTQCLNCGMFGHGISACHRKPKCFLCGEGHEKTKCNFDKDDDNQRIYKCFNCKENNLPHNHKANDIQCPMRIKYVEIKTSSNRKNGRNANANAKSNFTLNVNALPSLPARVPPPLTHSFAEAAKPQRQRFTCNRNVQQVADTNELFTFAEISEIMLNCVNELSKCTNKIEQLKVVANMLGHAFK